MTWGHRYKKNPRYTNRRYRCPYCTLRVSKSMDLRSVFDRLSNLLTAVLAYIQTSNQNTYTAGNNHNNWHTGNWHRIKIHSVPVSVGMPVHYRGSQSSWQLWSRDVTVATASGLQYGRHRENGRFSDCEIRANWNIGDIIDIRIRCWGHCHCISGAILSKLILFFQKEAMTSSLALTAIRFISGWPVFNCRLNWHWSFE